MKKLIGFLKKLIDVVFSVNLGGIYMSRSENGYYQTHFKPKNPSKCINLNMVESFKGIPSQNIKKDSLGKYPFARSSYESRMFNWLDLNKNVVSWGSEIIMVEYINDNDKKLHRYWLDIYMEMKHSDGIIRKHIVEIKPKKKLSPPKMPKNKTKKSMFNYEMAMAEYVQNQCKWKFAKRWADSNNMVFSKVTEEELLGAV